MAEPFDIDALRAIGAGKLHQHEARTLLGAATLIEQCIAAGFITPQGEVRRVLGTLPVTADGCIAGAGANVWCNYYGGPPSQLSTPAANTNGSPWEQSVAISTCYSTREAAQSARVEGSKP